MITKICTPPAVQQRATTIVGAQDLKTQAAQVHKAYKRETSLFQRILGYFHADYHTTVRWVCVCLDHAEEFKNSSLLLLLAKEHRSLRNALEQINQHAGHDGKISHLPSMADAIKFVVEKANAGAVQCTSGDTALDRCCDIGCRFDPASGSAGTFIFSLGHHTLNIDINEVVILREENSSLAWEPRVLAVGFEPHLPFYKVLENLSNLSKVEKPAYSNGLDATRSDYFKLADPLGAIAGEIANNTYNKALKEARNAVSEAECPITLLTPTKAMSMTSPQALLILEQTNSEIFNKNIPQNINERTALFTSVVSGCSNITDQPSPLKFDAYNLISAGLNVPLPHMPSLLINKLSAIVAAQPENAFLTCKEKFLTEYRAAMSAIEHYRDQKERVEKIQSNHKYDDTELQSLASVRCREIEECLNYSLMVSRELKSLVRVPPGQEIDDAEMGRMYEEVGHHKIVTQAQASHRSFVKPRSNFGDSIRPCLDNTCYPCGSSKKVIGAEILSQIELDYKPFRLAEGDTVQQSSLQPQQRQALTISRPGGASYKKINIKGDGYCFFRCLQIQRTNNEIWGNCASVDVRNWILNHYKDNIRKAIEGANTSLKNMGVTFHNNALRNELNNPQRLISHTIVYDGGYLWSPKGICAKCEPQIDYDRLSDTDKDNLEQVCNNVYATLSKDLNLDKAKGSYAVLNNGHYTWHKKL